MNRPESEPRNADERFLDALLERVHRDDRVARERRIEGALSRTVLRSRRRRWPTWGPRAGRLLAVAAVVLAAVLISTLGKGGAGSAVAAVQRSLDVMQLPVDRQYELQVEPAGSRGAPVPGNLYVRGGSLLAVRLEGMMGELWLGEGKDSSWVVPPPKSFPVFVSAKGRHFRRVLPVEIETPLPLLQISSILLRLKDDYDVEFGEAEGELTTLHARRTRAAGNRDQPVEIRLAVRADGVVQRLVMRWEDPEPGRPSKATLRHLGDRPLPDDFYEHASHHSGRPVIDRR